MATPNWFSRSSPFFDGVAYPFKIVGGIQLVVAEKLPSGAVEAVGAGFDRGIENRGAGTAKLGAEVGGLHLEFLQSRPPEEAQQSSCRSGSPRCRSCCQYHRAGNCSAPAARPLAEKAPLAALPRVSACGEFTPAASCARKVKFRPFRGRLLTLRDVDHLADGSVLGLEHGSARRYFDRLRHLARLQSEIDHHRRAHVDHDVALFGGLEPRGGSGKSCSFRSGPARICTRRPLPLWWREWHSCLRWSA